ncbi:phage holin family protein [Nonlabens ponticola]|uniref:Phage holin family protein n=1 Tax=Nonlabens ponticola TaxID=2496866 RepID=A0A3S9MUY4_9FLAO|nr:phage holin family protein [Nonlabens ponticola]AZQ42989.1 phage holin family protein [Nonlabens ponticola]
MNFLIKLLVTAVLVLVLSYIMPGVETTGLFSAVLVALALSILNFIVKPILVILTLPITVITLGIFLLFINAFIIMMADWLVGGFDVANVWYALIFALLLAIARSILFKMLDKEED